MTAVAGPAQGTDRDRGRVFALPDLGEGLTDAEVVEWRVAVGDVVEVDQVVVEVETAKAAVEVPVPFAGRVAVLHAAAGERLPVGSPLLTVEPEGTGEGSGNVLVGYGTGHAPRRSRRRRGAPAAAPALAAAPAPGNAPAPPPPDAPAEEALHAPGYVPRVVSPLVRRMALAHGLDLAALQGSGPGGVVRRCDVEAALAPPAEAAPVQPEPVQAAAGADDDEVRIPLRGVRRATAEHLSRSRREIPEVTVWVDVDATGLLEARAAIRAAHPEAPVGLLALLARITVHALGRFPELNARVEGDEIVQSRAVHLGIAAQTDRGLVVPVLRDAHRATLLDLATQLAATTAEARAGTLPPARLTGGTFTLNNYGVFGVDGSTPIINHPQAAILGVGRVADKPWAVDGALAVRPVTQLSLAFDHRVCDGGVAGGFLRYVADCVERPAVLLATL